MRTKINIGNPGVMLPNGYYLRIDNEMYVVIFGNQEIARERNHWLAYRKAWKHHKRLTYKE